MPRLAIQKIAVLFLVGTKAVTNKKGQKDFQVYRFRCLFLQLAAEKKTPNTVQFFWPFSF